MNSKQLKEILEKREQIMNKKKHDEYINIPHEEEEIKGVSTSSFEIYQGREQLMKYNLEKSVHDLSQELRLYLQKQRRRRNNQNIYLGIAKFLGFAGLIILNDYILINYII